MNVVGFVAAGGRSLRMGRDKALLPWGEADLLAHALGRLRGITDDVRILSGSEARYLDRDATVVTDTLRDAGPLAGTLAGLASAGGRSGLFLAVDLPHVPVALLEQLVSLAQGYDAVVPVSPHGPEPLCAVYGAGCLDPIRRRVERGDLKMTSFWPDVRVREVSPEELRAFGDVAELFRNLNTPEDLG